MSRVAKLPVILPKGVHVSIEDNLVKVTGPKGTLEQRFNKLVKISFMHEDEARLVFQPANQDPAGWAQSGTARSIVNNMVSGVTQGFERALQLVGVGYRAQLINKGINLTLGFSHPIEYFLPEGVQAEVPDNTTIVLKGMDKQKVGQVASEIRAYRSPEPYKGKGVRYAGEVIVCKEAKKK